MVAEAAAGVAPLFGHCCVKPVRQGLFPAHNGGMSQIPSQTHRPTPAAPVVPPVDDEAQIRDLVATWMSASRAGDIATVLGLMTDDAVFLLPGRPPMGKAEFTAVARAQASAPRQPAPAVDGQSEIQEIQLAGEWAFLWTRLSVTVTLPGGSPPQRRAGHTLTVLRKQGGRWRIARDANLLAPVPAEAPAR